MDTNPNKKAYWKNPERDVYKLVDTSYSGAKGWLTTYLPHLITPDCVDEQTNYNAILCNDNVMIKRIIFYDQQPWSDFNFRDVKIKRTSGTGQLMHDVEI